MGSLRYICFAVLAGAFLSTAVCADVPTNYLPAIRQELARLNIESNCDENTFLCEFSYRRSKDRPAFDTTVKYSSSTSTVYIYIERYLVLRNSSGPSKKLGRRLLELNSQMVSSKFEWNKEVGTIGISALLNTDTNFDRKAFRSQITGLLSVADRLFDELSKLLTVQNTAAQNTAGR